MGEGEYEGAKTSVWWDIEHCQVPRGCDPNAIARNIAAALVAAGYVGTVSISSYGDTNRVPTNVQHALSSTGIALNHVPAGVKDASDKKILVDMLLWAVDNPPPANYLLISGDRDFSNALHQLRMRKYNILLAQPPYGSQEMIAAAKSVWSYTCLLAGGSPLPMSSHVGNLVSGNILSAETSKTQETVQTAQSDSSFHGTFLGGHGNGRADSRYQRKQVLKYQNQSNTYVPRAPSNKFRQTQPENQGHASEILNNITSQRKHGMLLPNHMSVSQVSTSEAQDNARSNYTNRSSFAQTSSHKTVTEIGHFSLPEVKQFKEAPHEFLVAGKHNASSAPTPSNIPPHPDFPVSKRNPENHQTHNPQLLKSSDLQPRQPNYALGSSSAVDSYNHGSYPPTVRPDGLASTSCPSSGLPDMSKVSIADYNHNTSSLQPNQESNVNIVPQCNGAPHCMPSSYQDNVHSSPTFPSMDSNISNSAQWGTSRCPMPSSAVQTLMGEILHALHTLKLDKMAPTEENIADCIHYGEKLEDFNVKMALVYATEHRVVVMHKLGGNLPFYIGMSDILWKCVNIMDVNARHPKAIWDAVLEFLSLDDGRAAMLASRCRYEAAMMLRNSCLTYLVLGDILQILYLMTHVKKWILPHSSGWQPLCFRLPVAA